eukprot:672446-Rhodomonas_salina.1
MRSPASQSARPASSHTVGSAARNARDLGRSDLSGRGVAGSPQPEVARLAPHALSARFQSHLPRPLPALAHHEANLRRQDAGAGRRERPRDPEHRMQRAGLAQRLTPVPIP